MPAASGRCAFCLSHVAPFPRKAFPTASQSRVPLRRQLSDQRPSTRGSNVNRQHDVSSRPADSTSPDATYDAAESTSSSNPPRQDSARFQELVRSLQDVAQTRLRSLNSNAAVRRAQFEARLAKMGGKINEVTGYETIERLRNSVAACEERLLEVRQSAATAKNSYTLAVEERARSQREVNDLLQRKSSWSSADVVRFTELVQADHSNETAEREAKRVMQASELEVEKCFQELMKAILERYHEEQVWSDKIRSLSTYGSLSITGLNVLLFIVTILLVEPWKRRRLVEGVETRLRETTVKSNEATQSSLMAIRELIASKQEGQVDDAVVAREIANIVEPVDQTIDELTVEQQTETPSMWYRLLALRGWPDRHSDEETLLAGIAGVVGGVAITVLATCMRATSS